MEILNIITRCTRTTKIKEIFDSFIDKSNYFEIKWFVIFDLTSLVDIPTDILSFLKDKASIRFYESDPSDFGHQMINKTIDEIDDGIVYILDDDNILHPNFFPLLEDWFDNYWDLDGLLFNQKIGGIDFTGQDIRQVDPNDVKVGKIDMAQFCLKRKLIGSFRIPPNNYVADGVFIQNIYATHTERFLIKDEIGCYYNYYKQVEIKDYFLPRILVVGDVDKTQLKSYKYVEYEDDRLKCKHLTDDTDIDGVLSDFNPNAILSVGNSWQDFKKLSTKSYEFRRKWLHTPTIDQNTGEAIFNCANRSIFEPFYNNSPLISVFTPIFNTKETLWRTYESMQSQTYNNWEWVLVNDSTDGGKTLKVAHEIRSKDPRVKVYDFGEKSGGIVGESKYRAASLCSGSYLVELDHDDILLPEALRYVVEAFLKFPDAKFVYSDCAEIDQHHNSLTYGDNFAFGYGSYRDEEFNGRIYKAVNTQNINPKTIRHIVGVPNHLRAWDRFFYHSIGGHNRNLSIADDYELLVRTFLKTKYVRIPKMLYLQFFHNSNTQNDSRADIQRRVREISTYYNEKIRDRFIELGKRDWAYEQNPVWPLNTDSRFGSEEGYVNYIWKDEDLGLGYDVKHLNSFAFLN